MADERPTLRITKNGPIMVKGLRSLKDHKGNVIMTGRETDTDGPPPMMALCRCGESSTKPFCDGTHTKSGFTDEKKSDRLPDVTDTYEGTVLAINDNRGVCSHRGYCTDNAPKVFRMRTEPWIDPDGMPPDEAVAVIETCPSGALSYIRDGVLHKELDRKPGITVVKDGPYDVVGGPEYRDMGGDEPESKEHHTLCRCGHSKNKPFCNGQHWYVEFKDPVD